MRSLSPATRTAILEAAVGLLSDRDFSAVTTRELAAAAGVAEATLFRYFPRKEEILAALFEEESARFFSSLDSLLEVVRDPVERLHVFVRHVATFVFENRDLCWVFERELTYRRPTGELHLEKMRAFVARLEALVAEAVERGAFRSDLEPRMGAVAVQGLVRCLLVEERILGREPEDRADFLERSDLYLGLLLEGLRAPEGREP
jgi:AcrR family transcriptional regulator